MTFCFVSALYELRDGVVRKDISKFIENMSYIYNTNIDMVFFSDMTDRLSKIYPKFNYVSLDRHDLPVWDKITQSNTSTINGGFNTTTKEYSALTISKTYLINEAKNKYPDYDHYIWIDAGIASHGIVPYEELLSGLTGLTDKIKVIQMKYPEPYEREGDYLLRNNKGIIAAGIIAVPNILTEYLWDETINAVRLMISIGSLCLDEQVLAYINGKNMDIFDYWFSDYDVVHNIKYIRSDHTTILRNMHLCSIYNKHIACNIARVLLNTIEFISETPIKLIPDILYNVHLMSYYVPEEKHKGIPIHILVGKVIHYLLVKYKLNFPINVGDNLLYSGINIKEEPEMTSNVLCYCKYIN